MDRRRFFRQMGMATGLGLGAVQIAQAGEAAGDRSAFTFAVVADPHCGEGPSKGLEGCGRGIDKFRRCLDAMASLPGDERPDFLLLLGDIHPWVLHKEQVVFPLPVHAVAGNHESTDEKRQILRDLFPNDFRHGDGWRDYYSFVWNGVRFIAVCDAGRGGEHIGQFCSESILPRGQCEWIEEQLAMPEPRKVVFAHIPTEPEGRDRNMYLSRNDARWFNPLIERTRPEAMFFGHLHRATQEYRIGATRCFNVRSCSWNFGEAPIGFGLVRVDGAGMHLREVDIAAYRAAAG